MIPEGARLAAATDRNREPILAVLSRVLPAAGLVLEIASGTGQHAVFLAPRLPHLIWQPTDAAPDQLASIVAWTRAHPAANLLPPLALDVEADPWPVAEAQAIVAINMIHIAPWSACTALMGGAGRVLAPGGILYMYGPFKQDGRHTADSNAAFDARLRGEDARWGVRDVGEVRAAATAVGLELVEIVAMPANNLSLVFRNT